MLGETLTLGIGMTVDPTITFGALLNALVLLVGFAVAFTRIGGRIDLLSQRVKTLEETIKSHRDTGERLTALETRQTTHGSMLATIQTDIADIRRGRGFIQQEIRGEYPKA